MNKSLVKQSERFYDFLLRLYPKDFQQEFGQEMKFVFSENLADAFQANGRQGALYVWTKTCTDICRSVITQHLENHKGKNFMKNYKTEMSVSNRILRVFLITAGVLAVPFIGMQVSSEMNWSLGDFVIIGVLVAGAGAAYELISSQFKNPQHRTLVAIMVTSAVVLIWIELAVGIFS